MERSAVTRLVFVGGGRLAGILYSTFHRQYDVLGYVDDVYTNAYLSTTYGMPCLGTSAALAELRAEGVVAVVTITPAAARRKYAEMLDTLGFETTTLIFPTAVIDEHARVGKACIIRHQAVISAQVELGRNCMVADNAYVGHDSVIGAYTYISPGVNVNGSVTIGEGCFVGTGAVILPDRRVGAGCTIGAAACVVADVPDGQTVVGVPARALGNRSPGKDSSDHDLPA
jgi:sugar O-acyltransferase (sialic acid O-acetyltransferase NeuD family)